METITQEVARKLLFQSDAKYISQEQPVIFYDLFSGAFELETYTCHECLIVKDHSDYFIHALSDKADIVAAQNDVQMLKFPKGSIYAFSYGAPSENLKNKIGSHKFARKWFHYKDPDIRKITLEDREKVEFCCAVDPDDSKIGQDEAAGFLDSFSYFCTADDVCALGLFELNKLVGFIQGHIHNELGITTVSHLFHATGNRVLL